MYNHLREQKEIVKHEIYLNILPTLLVIILCALTPVSVQLLFEAKEKYINLFGIIEVAMVLLIAIYVLTQQVRLIKILITMRKATPAQECTKDIICSGARVIRRIFLQRHIRKAIGFILKDESGKKYYCILSQERVVYPDIWGFLKSKCFGRQFTIKYYEGTNILVEPPFTLYDYDLR